MGDLAAGLAQGAGQAAPNVLQGIQQAQQMNAARQLQQAMMLQQQRFQAQQAELGRLHETAGQTRQERFAREQTAKDLAFKREKLAQEKILTEDQMDIEDARLDILDAANLLKEDEFAQRVKEREEDKPFREAQLTKLKSDIASQKERDKLVAAQTAFTTAQRENLGKDQMLEFLKPVLQDALARDRIPFDVAAQVELGARRMTFGAVEKTFEAILAGKAAAGDLDVDVLLNEVLPELRQIDQAMTGALRSGNMTNLAIGGLHYQQARQAQTPQQVQQIVRMAAHVLGPNAQQALQKTGLFQTLAPAGSANVGGATIAPTTGGQQTSPSGAPVGAGGPQGVARATGLLRQAAATQKPPKTTLKHVLEASGRSGGVSADVISDVNGDMAYAGFTHVRDPLHVEKMVEFSNSRGRTGWHSWDRRGHKLVKLPFSKDLIEAGLIEPAEQEFAQRVIDTFAERWGDLNDLWEERTKDPKKPEFRQRTMTRQSLLNLIADETKALRQHLDRPRFSSMGLGGIGG